MKDILQKMAIDVDINVPCADGGCDSSGGSFASNIVAWAYFIIGIVAVIIIIYAGIQYITSEGEPDRAKKAQATITYAVIGLIVATLAAAIVQWVLGAFK